MNLTVQDTIHLIHEVNLSKTCTILMSEKCSTCRQPEPKENPECSLVKEGKTSVTEYLERKVSTVQYLLERLDKKKQDQKIEPEDPFATSKNSEKNSFVKSTQSESKTEEIS
jgi:hypothetical protein